MRALCAGNREMRSEYFASSKSTNSKAGAHVHPTREKCFSASLGGFFSTVLSVVMLKSLVGNAPNHTFGGTVYWNSWFSCIILDPRFVNLTLPSASFISTTWKKNGLEELWVSFFHEHLLAVTNNTQNNFSAKFRYYTKYYSYGKCLYCSVYVITKCHAHRWESLFGLGVDPIDSYYWVKKP